jgi:hypothetical protein
LKASQKKYQDPKTKLGRRRPLLNHNQYHKVQAGMARQRVLVKLARLAQWVGLRQVEEEEEEEEENQVQAPAPEVQIADAVFGGHPQSVGSQNLRCLMSIPR